MTDTPLWPRLVIPLPRTSPAAHVTDFTDASCLRAAQAEPVALPRELAKRFAPAFVVEPGDVLLVQTADLDSPVRLPGDQPILPDGTIQLGKYGRLVVGGKTVEEIEADVKRQVT